MSASYTSSLNLKIDGQAARSSLVEDILQVVVEESLHLPGMFTLLIRNDYFPSRSGENPWLYDNTFAIGKSVEIGFTSSTTEDTNFDDAEQVTLLKARLPRSKLTLIRSRRHPLSSEVMMLAIGCTGALQPFLSK